LNIVRRETCLGGKLRDLRDWHPTRLSPDRD
jgi:hypothetical protein